MNKTIEIPADVMGAAVAEVRHLKRFAGMSDGEITQELLTTGTSKITETRLKTRAKRHDIMIRKDGKGGYWLLDIYINGVVAPGPMTLEEVALWLDDLDSAQAH